MNTVTEHPIIFSGQMINAILADLKTQTRRVLNPQPEHLQYHEWHGKMIYDGEHRLWCWKQRTFENIWDFPGNEDRKRLASLAPYRVGDRLWVRESLIRPDGDPWLYGADRVPVIVNRADETAMVVWAHHKQQNHCPSIHMPRWASRITLEVTGVRVDLVESISEEDARAEGCRASDLATGRECLDPSMGSYRLHFQSLWESINGKRPGCAWADNPFVWIVEFRRIL
jgi:hypothetical protein